MRKYYIFITLLVVFSLGLVTAAILITGTPAKQRAIELDNTRLRDMSSLAIAISSYHANRDTLPATINDVKVDQDYLQTTDPQTNKSYTYKVTSSTTFDLCTTFSLDSKDNPSTDPVPVAYDGSVSSPSSPYARHREHKKGYDCLNYTVSADDFGPIEAEPVPYKIPESKALTN